MIALYWLGCNPEKGMVEYWKIGMMRRQKDQNPFKPIIPAFHYSAQLHFVPSIPWPRPGFHMAPVIILMSRQGGPIA